MQLIPIKPSRDVFGDDFDDRLFKVDELMRTLDISSYWIAGGYLRDREAGIAHKDIDVFLPGDEPPELAEGSHRYDLNTACVIRLGDDEVNFIRLNHRHTLETVLGRMDIGICQIGRDQSGTIVATQAYLDDVQHKTLTILEPPRTDHDTDHIRRVRAKFPDHRVIYA